MASLPMQSSWRLLNQYFSAMPKARKDKETVLRIARHEAGHCTMAWRTGVKPIQVSIVARRTTGGRVFREESDGRGGYTKGQIEDAICAAMAGRAAEILYYGEEEGCSSGVRGDLEAATHWARLMVQHYGMDDRVGLVAMDFSTRIEGPLAVMVNKSMDRIIRTQLARAVEELSSNRATLDLLVEQLMDKNRLSREDLEKIFAQS
jgi:ATP-dependent Zn protease